MFLKYHSDLDYILIEGDSNFKRLGFTESLFVDQFPTTIKLEGYNCSIEFSIHNGEFVSDDIVINFVSERLLSEHCGVIFVIDGYSFAIMVDDRNQDFYIFDSHSRDIMGNIVPNGTSVLMKFSCLKSVKNYIRKTYKSNFFQLLYVKTDIDNFHDMKNFISKSVRKRQNKIYYQKSKESCDKMGGFSKYEKRKEKNRERNKRTFDDMKGTEKHEKAKEKWRENSKRNFDNMKETKKYEQIKEKWRENSKRNLNNIKGTVKHKEYKEKMRKMFHIKKTKELNRVSKFKNLIQEGPYFICVCCNRSFYKRSVIFFKDDKYCINTDDFIQVLVKSYDGKIYICLTCHKKLLKNDVPCQSVTNKLQIFEFSDT